MIRILVASVIVTAIAVLMAMIGRGGGNFYVPLLVATGAPMLEAATSAQLILVTSAAAATLVFHKHRTVDWKLVLVIDPPTDVMAFVGGFCAHRFAGLSLKFVFAGLLVLASFFMLRPVKERNESDTKRFGFWNRSFEEHHYMVNLWLTLPITASVGFLAGMVGISGGSFKVPLMVLACGVPMRIAIGSSSAMVAVTAMCGFFGHTLAGDLNLNWALPVAALGALGGLTGGRISVKTDQERLKRIFAYTTLAAAAFMVLNSLLSK
jgi:uncharacterized membrane protein YfcA